MEKELHKITITPARFVEKRDDKYIIECFLDDNYTENRIFDSFALEGMISPKYLLIGIMTGVGYSQINFCQADEFENLFKKKWAILTK